MEQLRQEAKQIRDETISNQNTATRIGGWMVRLLARIPELFQEKIGQQHDVSVETIDYGQTPSSSMTFNGEKFNLKLQIPRGKDGVDGEDGRDGQDGATLIIRDGNFEISDPVTGSTTVDGTTGFEFVVDPANPPIDKADVVQGVSSLSVSIYQRKVGNIRLPLINENLILEAVYRKRHTSGLTTDIGKETVKIVTAKMSIPAQKVSGSNRSNILELNIKEANTGNIRGSYSVQYNVLGSDGNDGEDGKPGGTYIPVIDPSGRTGFELVEREGDTPAFIEEPNLIPSISKEGKWVIGGQTTSFQADAQPAINAAMAAADAAKQASSSASSAHTAAQKAASAAESAAEMASSAKIMATRKQDFTAGSCSALNILDSDYVILNITNVIQDSPVCTSGFSFTITDKICYILFINSSTDIPVVVSFDTGSTFAPASSVTISPQACREISYYKSSQTGKMYINYGPEMKQL